MKETSPIVKTFFERCTSIIEKDYSGTKRRTVIDSNTVPVSHWRYQQVSPSRQLLDNVYRSNGKDSTTVSLGSSTSSSSSLVLPSKFLSPSRTAFLISNILDYMLKRATTTGMDFATLLSSFFLEKHGKGDTCNDIIFTFLISCGCSLTIPQGNINKDPTAGILSNEDVNNNTLLQPYTSMEFVNPQSPPFGLAYLMCIATGTLPITVQSHQPSSSSSSSTSSALVNNRYTTVYDYEPAFGGAFLEILSTIQRILSGTATPSTVSSTSSSKSASLSATDNGLSTLLFQTPPSLLRTPVSQDDDKQIPFIARRITLPMALTIINDLFASSIYFSQSYLDVYFSQILDNCRYCKNSSSKEFPDEIKHVLEFRSLGNGWSILNRQALLRFIVKTATGVIKPTVIPNLPLPNYLQELSFDEYQYPNPSKFFLPRPQSDTILPSIIENVSLPELQTMLSKPVRSTIDMELFLVGCLQLWIIEHQYMKYTFRYLTNYLQQQYTVPISLAIKQYTEKYTLPIMNEAVTMARTDVSYHIEPTADAYRQNIQTMIDSIVSNSILYGDPILAQQIILQLIPDLCKDTLKISSGMVYSIANDERKTNLLCNELVTQRMNAENASRAAAAIAYGATDVRDAMEKRLQNSEQEIQELRKQLQEYKLKHSTLEMDLTNQHQQHLKDFEERLQNEYELRQLTHLSLVMDSKGNNASKDNYVSPAVTTNQTDRARKTKEHDVTYYEHPSSTCCILM